MVGLGFPRQEKLIERLQVAWPGAWYLACGGAIAMAAGVTPRAAPLMQRLGLEWLHRMALEPRRLAARYLRDDLPFVIRLLFGSLLGRLRRRRPARGPDGPGIPQIPCPRWCRTRRTVPPDTAPEATASAKGTRRSCQFCRSARTAHRAASRRRPRQA